MKLRMLNGSHSFLAYLGYLAGYEHINDCMADNEFKRAAYELMLREQAVTLKVTGVDLTRYADELIARYCNPALRHRTWQIAMDGSQKLPQRMLDSVQFLIDKKQPFNLLALGIAGWMRYVSGKDEHGKNIEVCDPIIQQLQSVVNSSETDAEMVTGLLSIKSIFGQKLPQNPLFINAVTKAFNELVANGSKETVRKYVSELA
ncbi:D-mannonate oxidoreductase [Klebsiella pneumoniae]|nr:D-mannonate oxidoreductase [Klebsiella pneumoniae]